jgi:YHS domain-containing protein
MGDLAEFTKRVQERLRGAGREPHWTPEEAERYMTAVSARRERFEQLATRLTESVIRPRLETLAGSFPNADLATREPPGRASCWFGYCERFPASTKVSFAVEHDVQLEKVSVCYEATMMPVFIKLNERDKLTVPLEAVDDAAVADWVQRRLLEFLDAYLRIDRGGEDFDDESVTDPVCGMRITRASAAASDNYRGHLYFFCSRECHERFRQKPTAYVEVKTM